MISCIHWTTYLSALLTPTIALTVAAISYRQWRTAQNKLKLDLFERRLKVYEAAKDLLLCAPWHGEYKDEMRIYAYSVQEAKWILSEDLARYLSADLYKGTQSLVRLSIELEQLPAGQAKIDKATELLDAQNKFQEQFMVLDEKFSPFLRLSQ